MQYLENEAKRQLQREYERNSDYMQKFRKPAYQYTVEEAIKHLEIVRQVRREMFVRERKISAGKEDEEVFTMAISSLEKQERLKSEIEYWSNREKWEIIHIYEMVQILKDLLVD